MKKELLEYLVRSCVREVLTQKTIREANDDIKGAAAPPADGQGTADQPEIPNEKPEIPDEPSEPETPETPQSSNVKGVVMVNPRDKSKLQKVPVKAGDDASLERNLHKIAATVAGPQVKIALSTLRLAKETAKNSSATCYLYFGKYDPQSNEIFLMADKSLQVAKDSSIPPTELSGSPTTSFNPDDTFQPMSATSDDFSSRMQQQGQSPVRGIDEQKLRNAIRKIVKETLNKQ